VQLSGTSAIVTGGSGGLGEATVRRLVGAGVATVIADLAEDRSEALAVELGDLAAFVRTDVTNEDSVKAAVAKAQELGSFRISVAAHGGWAQAGRLVGRDGEPLDLDGFRKTLELYVVGTFNIARLAAASMVASEPDDAGNRGVLINTASIAAFEGQVGQLPYAAAKGAVVSMGLVGARDLSPAGVRVMTIAPGTFFTPAFQLTEEQAQEYYGSKVPFPKRMGHPDEYAALVVHIAENDYLNGDVIRLDGANRFGLK
jgi:NAD(P)-dependent dehydrogenase (short-subunit alcohol dehydrogenase family)